MDTDVTASDEQEGTNKPAEANTKLNLLLIDDESHILSALTRLLRKDYNIVSFNEGQEALDYLANNTVQIIMSDMRMPAMDGAQFLSEARKIQPDSIRILLTGYSDMESTISAINDGRVYTYIGKPWDNDSLKLTLEKAANHFTLKQENFALTNNLISANDELAKLNQSLEERVAKRTQALQASKQKLADSLHTQKSLLADVLDMLSATIEYRTGHGTSHLSRVAKQCRSLARKLKLDDAACRRIYFCGLLHEIGMVGLSDEVLNNFDMSNATDDAVTSHPVIGATIVGRLKRLAGLTDNILHQNENYDGTGTPKHLSGQDIPIGARIIRVVKDFDYLVAGLKNDNKMSISNAQAWMKERANIWYDRKILETFNQLLIERGNTDDDDFDFSVGLERLKIGDVLAEDLVLHNGNIMLKAGQEINQIVIDKIRQYEETYNTKVTLFTS